MFAAVSITAILCVAEVGLRVYVPLTHQTVAPNGALLDWRESKPYACRVSTIVWEADFAENATPEAIQGWDEGKPTIDYQGTRFYRHPVRGWDCDSGFRGRRRTPEAFSPSATTRVLAVGDSFTFGSDVGANEAWCHVLEQSIPGAEVFNAGVPGYGVDQIALKLDDHGPRLKPPIVIWGLVNDDVLRAGRAWFPKSWMTKPRVTVAGDTWSITPPRTRLEVYEGAKGWRSRLGLVARAGADLVWYPFWKRSCVALFRDLMRISKSRVESWGGRLVVVYMPTGGPLLRDDDDEGEELMGICRELGLEVVDIRTAIREQGLSEKQIAEFTLKPDGRGHYTRSGNARVAKIVRDHLLRSR